MGSHGIGKIYGQEKKITTYNLARMRVRADCRLHRNLAHHLRRDPFDTVNHR